MTTNPVRTPEVRGPYELFDLGDSVPEERYTLRDCAVEQGLLPSSELRVAESSAGHLGLLAFEPGHPGQIDRHLNEPAETPL